jgi:site-specific recombinase XerD
VTALAPTLQAFFTDRLMAQRQASPKTIAAYRDALRLLVGFVSEKTAKAPSVLDIADLDAATIMAFLQHLESDRHNSARTRNARLAAVRSLFRYASLRHPEHAADIARVLAIPQKRFEKKIVSFLTRTEIDALLDAPDPARWEGRRDRALLALAVQTGLRVSELTGLNCGDITLDVGPHLHCAEGKGRKQRAVPLTAATVAIVRSWMSERNGAPDDPLFPTRTGRRLSRDAIARRVATHTATAAQMCPALKTKHLTPHVLRHSCAMALLHAGVDTSVISLWLGHEDIRSTQIYLHADMAIKERALARTNQASASPGRYRAPDPILAFLESL